MSKKVAVLMTDHVEDIEYTSPKEAIESAGYTVEVITPDGSAAEGKKGGKFAADKSTDDANPEDYAGLLVPGGFAPDVLRGDAKNAEFAKHFLENDKPTFAICHGPQFLVDTDLLKGRNVTSVGNVKKDLENAGATFHDKSVVVCHNLVTSRTPDDLEDFNNAIKDQLK
ncbi:type 1 glutamine amidotransferase domain-containing protein [Corticicoccus populi]|uniref:Type 1 glutamine amidotransferase domain-containing protein n=1 Tax=Corticicoccus populi TaxID=1812821 RepID=A0ABW5WUI0_9STAP